MAATSAIFVESMRVETLYIDEFIRANGDNSADNMKLMLANKKDEIEMWASIGEMSGFNIILYPFLQPFVYYKLHLEDSESVTERGEFNSDAQ